MHYWPEFIALALVHFLAVVAPGPDFAVTVRPSLRFGQRVGIWTALGIGAGMSVHIIYTLLGVGALLQTSAQLMLAARILGAGYLLYLAWQFLRAQPAKADQADSNQPEAAIPSAAMAFRTGFLTNATNPKATLFFLAVFTTIVSPATPLPVQLGYGLWMCLVNALWFVGVSLMFSRAWLRQAFLRIAHWIERGIGLLLLAFACRLFWSV